MPGPIVHAGASVQCVHGGMAQPTTPMPRVLVSGQPVVTIACSFIVAGCAFPPPPAGNGPCVTGQFLTMAARVLAGGAPVLLQDSVGICVPTGTPLMVVSAQLRVIAQ